MDDIHEQRLREQIEVYKLFYRDRGEEWKVRASLDRILRNFDGAPRTRHSQRLHPEGVEETTPRRIRPRLSRHDSFTTENDSTSPAPTVTGASAGAMIQHFTTNEQTEDPEPALFPQRRTRSSATPSTQAQTLDAQSQAIKFVDWQEPDPAENKLSQRAIKEDQLFLEHLGALSFNEAEIRERSRHFLTIPADEDDAERATTFVMALDRVLAYMTVKHTDMGLQTKLACEELQLFLDLKDILDGMHTSLAKITDCTAKNMIPEELDAESRHQLQVKAHFFFQGNLAKVGQKMNTLYSKGKRINRLVNTCGSHVILLFPEIIHMHNEHSLVDRRMQMVADKLTREYGVHVTISDNDDINTTAHSHLATTCIALLHDDQ